MPIKLKSPLKKDFHLIKSDEAMGNTDGATMITVRQATQGDFERVDDLTSEYKREFDGKTVKAIQRISFDDIRRKQVYLTLCACNILGEDEQTPLWTFKNEKPSSEASFESGWYKLPPVVAQEIYEKVLEMNPLWDDRVPKPSNDDNTPEKSGNEES